MKDLELSLEDIKELLVAVKNNNIEELNIRQDDFSIKIKGQQPNIVVTDIAPVVAPASACVATVDAEEIPVGTIVPSPIVGTFYASPGPDKESYVQVGSKVAKGDVLFIIESMKLMNEVTSDLAGTVTAIHVTDGEGVEYGQPILTIA